MSYVICVGPLTLSVAMFHDSWIVESLSAVADCRAPFGNVGGVVSATVSPETCVLLPSMLFA